MDLIPSDEQLPSEQVPKIIQIIKEDLTCLLHSALLTFHKDYKLGSWETFYKVISQLIIYKQDLLAEHHAILTPTVQSPGGLQMILILLVACFVFIVATIAKMKERTWHCKHCLEWKILIPTWGNIATTGVDTCYQFSTWSINMPFLLRTRSLARQERHLPSPPSQRQARILGWESGLGDCHATVWELCLSYPLHYCTTGGNQICANAVGCSFHGHVPAAV